MSCSPNDCCSAGVPDATCDRVGPERTARTIRMASCRNCGNDPHAIVRAFNAGVQAAYWDTYAGNVASTAARERADLERQAVQRWHE